MDPFPKHTIFNVLQRVGRKPITCLKSLLTKKRTVLSENQVRYVEHIIVKRDTANLVMSRKEAIQVIYDISQEKSFVQAENHLDYLIWVKRLTHLKMLGRVVADQATTT